MNKLSKTSTMSEGLPLDFAEYLSRRLNVEPSAVLPLLGEYLVDYKPQRSYEIVLGSSKTAA